LPTVSDDIVKLLLNQLASGSEIAFRQIFDLYKERFYGVALKISTSEFIAEEVVQEVFITIWSKRGILRDIDRPTSYLFTIFYRALYEQFKKQAKQRRLQNRLLDSPLVMELQDDQIAIKELQYQLLEEAIAALPPQQAMVYRLSKQEGMSRTDIARQLNLSPNTVRNHLVQAIKSLEGIAKKAGVLFFWWLLK